MTPEEFFKLLKEQEEELEEVGIPVPSKPEEIREPRADDAADIVEFLITAMDEGNPLVALREAVLNDGEIKIVAIKDIDSGDAVVLAKAGEKVYAWRWP